MFHEETKQGKLTDFFLIFGRVPLFYYFLHMVVIHVFAIIGILIFGGNWQDMILIAEGFGFALCYCFIHFVKNICCTNKLIKKNGR